MATIIIGKLGLALLTGIGLGLGFYVANVLTWNTLTEPWEKLKQQRMAGEKIDVGKMYEHVTWIFKRPEQKQEDPERTFVPEAVPVPG